LILHYVGSAACRSCHQNPYDAWYGSYHRTMTQSATEQSVLGDFNNVRLSGKDLNVRLFKQGGQFMAELKFQNPAKGGTFPVVLTTGSHHRQAYWMMNPDDSQLMILPYMYLRAEQRWIPRHAGYVSTIWRHDTPEKEIFKGEYGRWSVVCINCHTTHGQPTPVDQSGTPSPLPRVAEFGISCEACHGPAATHVQAKSDPATHEELPAATDVVNPARLAHDRSAQVCGQCHVVFANRNEEVYNRWLQNGDTFRPGDDLFTHPIHYIVRGRADLMPDRPDHVADPAESGSFWSDGMIRTTGREFNGLLESPCFQRGQMSCLSCHQMHQKRSDPRPRTEWAVYQLKPGMDGNRACVQCHGRYKDAAALSQHTHHPAESSGSHC
jgi:formate-dependent nitrite reductase cytochrome c552 subunit